MLAERDRERERERVDERVLEDEVIHTMNKKSRHSQVSH